MKSKTCLNTVAFIIVFMAVILLLANCSTVPVVNQNMYELRVAYSPEMKKTLGFVVAKANWAAVDEETKEIGPYAERKVKGVGFWVGPELFMTAKHVGWIPVDPVEYFMGVKMKGLMDVKDRTWTVNGKEATLFNMSDDAIILHVSGAYDVPYFKFATKLKIGQQVINVGNTHLVGINVKRGIISDTEAPIGFNEMYEIEVDDKNIARVSMPIGPGDSGSPIFTIENGKYVYAGMVIAMLNNCTGIIHKPTFLNGLKLSDYVW